jgi:hypothetical protein
LKGTEAEAVEDIEAVRIEGGCWRMEWQKLIKSGQDLSGIYCSVGMLMIYCIYGLETIEPL